MKNTPKLLLALSAAILTVSLGNSMPLPFNWAPTTGMDFSPIYPGGFNTENSNSGGPFQHGGINYGGPFQPGDLNYGGPLQPGSLNYGGPFQHGVFKSGGTFHPVGSNDVGPFRPAVTNFPGTTYGVPNYERINGGVNYGEVPMMSTGGSPQGVSYEEVPMMPTGGSPQPKWPTSLSDIFKLLTNNIEDINDQHNENRDGDSGSVSSPNVMQLQADLSRLDPRISVGAISQWQAIKRLVHDAVSTPKVTVDGTYKLGGFPLAQQYCVPGCVYLPPNAPCFVHKPRSSLFNLMCNCRRLTKNGYSLSNYIVSYECAEIPKTFSLMITPQERMVG